MPENHESSCGFCIGTAKNDSAVRYGRFQKNAAALRADCDKAFSQLNVAVGHIDEMKRKLFVRKAGLDELREWLVNVMRLVNTETYELRVTTKKKQNANNLNLQK